MTGLPTQHSQKRAQTGNATRWIAPRMQDASAGLTVELTSSGNTLLVTGIENEQIVITHLEYANGDTGTEVVFVREGTTGDAIFKVPVRGESVVSRNLFGSELRLSPGGSLYGNRSGSTDTVYITVSYYIA